MDVVFLTQTYPRFAGDTAGPFIRDLARALVRRGDRVRVLAPHAPGVAAAWDDDGVEVATFRYAPERWEVLGYSRSLEADETVRGGAAAVTPLYAPAARRALVAALARRPADLVHGHWIVPNGVVAAALPRGEGAPAVAAGLHGSDVFLAEKALVRPAVRWALGRTALVTGCSPELVDRVCALGFDRRRAWVIPYGVDTGLFAPAAEAGPGAAAAAGEWRRRLGVPAAAPLVLSVGRMATKKGYHVLAAALPRLLAGAPDAHFVLAGAGDLLERLRAVTGALPGGERVHLPGGVLRDAPARPVPRRRPLRAAGGPRPQGQRRRAAQRHPRGDGERAAGGGLGHLRHPPGGRRGGDGAAGAGGRPRAAGGGVARAPRRPRGAPADGCRGAPPGGRGAHLGRGRRAVPAGLSGGARAGARVIAFRRFRKGDSR